MKTFRRIRWRKRSANIPVYYVSAVVDGYVQASPLGWTRRLSDAYESEIRKRHNPVGSAYINETLNGVSVILAWTGEEVDAMSFLSADDARVCLAITPFTAEEVARFDGVLTHFPRRG